MKKLILILIFTIFLSPAAFASDNYMAYLGNPKQQTQLLEKEVRSTLKKVVLYTNTQNKEALKDLYASNFVSSDGFSKEIFFDLIEKTWNLYPDIKYTTTIQNITVNGNTAVVLANETARATTIEKVEENEIKGYLKSKSNCLYYMEKVGDNWLITSESIVDEETRLLYGEVNNIKMELTVPQLVPANKEYTASLNIHIPDRNLFAIVSIGQERITYPQENAEEVFRKLPESGIIERIFKANNQNFNEFTIASIGLTRATANKNKDIRLTVTGLGYIITRTNIISEKNFPKVKDNGTKKTTAKLVD